ncbi:Asp-tRNA(Asn)/Glu-tRNA(Gln) amidotransferase subunit GatA [Tissierella creatinophila]|uniref:Glutamyl-tRNA(Gln) amidotransferase subunit A n=1 Tax=Tissierella creatinophila DSM 6911 TaxID=1123403 RepID=A0A1U7M751_TISCR|nr:Asp-tRNA(Asn)/Glu-tRNA(Gln) amidotransferase subunit GatA [Tissierella creatinophila]OLS03127.1 glutamyl-tRNA(Gln) amidotransferase subunit A [Tissierella creatinophila DSM 6911]
MDISDLKAWEMREKLLKGEISSFETIKSHIKNIEEKEKVINAFITFDKEKSLEAAQEIDRKLKNKEKLGILAGLPISVKDNIITKDFRTTCGSKMLENFIPPYDASVIEKIKDKDGIIIGKTNMDEFSMGETTKSSYFGATKNPLDITKNPGGSSGGSAASVASREASLSVGSDTGNSIRKPAAYCQVVGIKPTYGLVSRYGLITISNSLDTIGVFGRDVRDASLMLSAISGRDPLDITTKDTSLNVDLEGEIKGLKIGIPKEWMSLEMDTSVREDFQKSIEEFKSLGALVEEVSIPNIVHSEIIYKIIVCSDISSNMARFDGVRYGFRAKEYETLDELYKLSRTEGFGEEVKRRILFGTYLLSGHRGDEYYKKAQRVRTLIIDDFDNAFSKFDLLITPTDLNKPANLKEDTKQYNDYNASINLAGLPSISLPMGGKNSQTSLQIIGDRFKDEMIIKAALAFEGAVK